MTTADVIEMTQLADRPSEASDVSDPIKFSPDGSQFVILVKRGNLDQNTNDFSLLLFRTGGTLHSAPPETLAKFSSDSSRPGIQRLAWLDNETLSFLGEHPGERQQIYKLNCRTKELNQLTHYSGGILNYSLSSDGRAIVFLAEPQEEAILTDRVRRTGILVSDQDLLDLVSLVEHPTAKLFVQQGEASTPTALDVVNTIPPQSGLPLAVSPNGHYVVLEAYVRTVPKSWMSYRNDQLQRLLQDNAKGGSDFYDVGILLLVDLTTGQSKPLLDAPVPGMAQVVWSDDSNSVVAAGTYLPLQGKDTMDRKERESQKFVAEVRVPDGTIIAITSMPATILQLENRASHLVLQKLEPPSAGDKQTVEYMRSRSGWQQVTRKEASIYSDKNVRIEIDESPNTPPRLVMLQSQDGKKTTVFDFNPQFRNLDFGRVEQLAFTTRDGRQIRGGLYYPAAYRPGERYPLVIQTHGWNPTRFWIDGPYSTGFIAQPLAGHQIFVLQLEEETPRMYSPIEGDLEMKGYETAIDYLDKKGLIDPTRVGLIGFSRTDYHVKYALTHSTYTFAAAATAAGFDAGYFQYIAYVRASPSYAESFEAANSGPPFGAALSAWLKQSPGFSLDKVRTPVRLLANGRESLFDQWEWFSGLSRLRKPVEMIYLPEADHVLIKPWERMTVQGGNVAWFVFWLTDQELEDPNDAGQYERWRSMRSAQEHTMTPQ